MTDTFTKRKIILMLDEYEIAAIEHALRDETGAAKRVGDWIRKAWDMNLKPESPWHMNEQDYSWKQ